MKKLKLGVNIDHVATVRNARGGFFPDPIKAAQIALESGADFITAHLREDRRHIKDEDIVKLSELQIPLNLEMAATEEMLNIAICNSPQYVCLVPEKREELTTEGGLDLITHYNKLEPFIKELQKHHISVSLFVDANPEQIRTAKQLNANAIELHTGVYCNSSIYELPSQFNIIKEMAYYADNLGLKCAAGHGLNYELTAQIATIAEISELNIGHFIIGEAIFKGLKSVIQQMRIIIDFTRQ